MIKKPTKRELLKEFCVIHVKNQRKMETKFQSVPKKILMRDRYGDLKLATKEYYLYLIEEDEYDTEQEYVEEEDIQECNRIIEKFRN